MSSVPKYKRNESNVEFHHTFLVLRKELIMILMRDFGIKKRNYSIKLMKEIYGITDEDMKRLDEIHEKYGITGYEIEKYPSWLIETWRKEILSLINVIGVKIISANSIYITSYYEYYKRRNHWNEAIGYLYALLDKIHEIISCINVSIGAYEHVTFLIEKEVKLIKGLRRSDNKTLKKIEKQPWFNMLILNQDTCNEYPDFIYDHELYIDNNGNILEKSVSDT